MENSMSRILIETTVRQTLKGLQDNPKRSVRNLVDMALHFSEGRFQYRFFQTAHTMLEHQDSAYYALVEDAVKHIETEHLVRFGMNLGYNSCTWGARKIRTNERKLGCNISWTVLLQLTSPLLSEHFAQYDRAIDDGESLGIYSWTLLTRGPCRNLIPLIQHHPDSAFFLFCQPEEIDDAFLKTTIEPLRNLMTVVRWGNAAKKACAALRKAKLPYSVCFPYSPSDLPAIQNGDLFRKAQLLHPLFTVLAARQDCSPSVQHSAHEASVAARKEQGFQTVPWELYHDIRYLDEIISDDPCCLMIDAQGRLLAPDNPNFTPRGNLFEEGLPSLIQRAYPKLASVCSG